MRPVRIQFPEDTKPPYIEVAMEPPAIDDVLTIRDRDSKVETEWKVERVRTVIDIDSGELAAHAQVVLVAEVSWHVPRPCKKRA